MTKAEDKMVKVKLPPFFVHFLARRARVNQHYRVTREESEEWLVSTGKFDAKLQQVIHKTDFTFFVAIIAPDADIDRFRLMCDWGNWVFPFDDVFDNGDLREKLDEVRLLMDGLSAAMDDKPLPDPQNGLVVAFKSIWDRVENCPAGIRRRFAKSMQDYSEGCIQQVIFQSEGRGSETLSVKDFIEMRRGSIATAPLYALFEYAYGLDIPDEVFECPSIRELERISTDLVVIQNDIISYRKERILGETHNLINVYLEQGFAAQAAFDEAAKLLSACYRDWYLALAELPSWGEAVDAQVQTYIEGVQNVVLANVNWSFRADRYWDCNADIRHGGVMEIALS